MVRVIEEELKGNEILAKIPKSICILDNLNQDSQLLYIVRIKEKIYEKTNFCYSFFSDIK